MSDENKSMESTVSTEKLISLGGRFYQIQGIAYCDTQLDTYRINDPQIGWVKVSELEGKK